MSYNCEIIVDAECDKCGNQARFTSEDEDNPEFVIVSAGWYVGKRSNKVLCAACAEKL